MNRREFMASGLAGLAAASAPARPRPFILDDQSHLFCPEVVALMERRERDPVVRLKDGVRTVIMGDWHRKILPNHSDVDAKLAAMDAGGVSVAALSINDPGPEWFGDEGPAVARIMNDYVAGIARKHPSRFFGLAVLPLQDEKAAQAELDRCVTRLGMKGILLYTNLAGRFPDEPEFRWLFHRASELNLPVLLHPALPVTAAQVKGYEMISSLGNMFDDTLALTRIIMSGILDQVPGLKLVCPHLGGTLPYIVGRLDHQVSVLKRGPRHLARLPSEYLRQVWFDVVSPLPLAMKFCRDLVGAGRLVFGSDHPWVDPKLILDGLRSLGLPREEEEAILGGNARKLFAL